MDNLLSLAFEAHHAEKNFHRRYQITIGRDLFGEWTVAIHYGRAGRAGRQLLLHGERGRRYFGDHPRPTPGAPLVRSQQDRLSVSIDGVQHRARLRCRRPAPGRDPREVLLRDVTCLCGGASHDSRGVHRQRTIYSQPQRLV